jgi:hypothetical protein
MAMFNSYVTMCVDISLTVVLSGIMMIQHGKPSTNHQSMILENQPFGGYSMILHSSSDGKSLSKCQVSSSNT